MTALRLADLELHRRRRAVLLTAVRLLVSWIVLGSAYFLAPVKAPSDGATLVWTVLGGLIFVAMLALQLRRIVRAELPELRAVEAVGVLVPLFVVLVAWVYWTLSTLRPDEFNEVLDRSGALYFTVAVLATVGFGDIVPVGAIARNLVTAQMVVGALFAVALVRVIMTVARFSLRNTGPDEPAAPEPPRG